MTKVEQIQIQNRIDELTTAINAGDSDVQLTLWEMERTEKRKELDIALAEEANQQAQIDREQAQEEEVQAITLPYDFNDILSEPDHPVTAANEMIIEVVRDVKRQANIEKNQAVDEVKAEYEGKLKVSIDREAELQQQNEQLQASFKLAQHANQDLNQNFANLEGRMVQLESERDDAYAKRDAAFRQLQEAQDTIRSLEIKLENLPAAKQSLEISSSDKLAQMVKDSLAEKVNRGLSRWPEIKPLDLPEIVAVENVSAEPAEAHTFPETVVQTTDSGTDQTTDRNATQDTVVEQNPAAEETPVTRAEFQAALDRIERIEIQANIKAVA